MAGSDFQALEGPYIFHIFTSTSIIGVLRRNRIAKRHMVFPSGEHATCTHFVCTSHPLIILGLMGSVLIKLAHIRTYHAFLVDSPPPFRLAHHPFLLSPTHSTQNVTYPAASVSIWLKFLVFTCLKSHWLRYELKMSPFGGFLNCRSPSLGVQDDQLKPDASFVYPDRMIPSLGVQGDQLDPDASYVDHVLGAAYDIRLCEEMFNGWATHLDKCVQRRLFVSRVFFL